MTYIQCVVPKFVTWYRDLSSDTDSRTWTQARTRTWGRIRTLGHEHELGHGRELGHEFSFSLIRTEIETLDTDTDSDTRVRRTQIPLFCSLCTSFVFRTDFRPREISWGPGVTLVLSVKLTIDNPFQTIFGHGRWVLLTKSNQNCSDEWTPNEI